MGKRLLIIGNGFDLAHKLPTYYADFFDFSYYYSKIDLMSTTTGAYYDDLKSIMEEWNGNDYLKISLLNLLEEKYNEISSANTQCVIHNERLKRLISDITDNSWFSYLYQLHKDKKMKGKMWIDIEKEMSILLQWIDAHVKDLDESYSVLNSCFIRSNDRNMKTVLFHDINVFLLTDKIVTITDFLNRLYADLERFTDAFEMYLQEFVENMPVNKLQIIEDINPDYVISFNYTHTYRRVYSSDVPICFIHGECRNGLDGESNLVLGIDEYLDNDSRDTNTNMAIFKKFVQRIRKKNDSKYHVWDLEMKKTYIDNTKSKNLIEVLEGFSDVFVFGHSLDITDKDILERFLKPEYTKLHIYSKDKINEGKLISNLIKIIGEDTLIEKANHSPTGLETIISNT